MKRIHVVGVSPRTGTTLLAEAINACFEIDYSTSHEDRLFARAPIREGVFVTKHPRDITIVRPSLAVDPNLYVVCMVRDPRDIVVSTHQKDPAHFWCGLKFWKEYSKAFWRLQGHSRFLAVLYERFVSDPDDVQATLVKHMPFLTQKAKFSDFHVTATVSESSRKALGDVRPIRPASIGKWRQHKARVAGQIYLHGSIAGDLVALGYEEGETWTQEIEGIELDFNPSHHSEYFTRWEQVRMRMGKYAEAFRRVIERVSGRTIKFRSVPF